MILRFIDLCKKQLCYFGTFGFQRRYLYGICAFGAHSSSTEEGWGAAQIHKKKLFCAKIVLIIAAFLMLLPNAGICGAVQRKIVVVVANKLILSDFDNPSLHSITKIIRGGSAALISPNCVGNKTEESVILTAASGANSNGGDYCRQCYDAKDKIYDFMCAGDVYYGSTGNRVGNNSGVFLGIGRSIGDSQGLSSPVLVCALGDAIKKSGKKTCAIGNSDVFPDEIDRRAAMLAADSNGLISCGNLDTDMGSRTQQNAYGLLSDKNVLLQSVRTNLQKSDFIVVDFGDFSRLNESKPVFSESMYAKYRLSALNNLDSFLGSLISDSKLNVTVVLVSFCPSANNSWNHLTPVFVYPTRKPGVLVSPTTRTPGLIAASDFAPTILGLMGIKSGWSMLGREAHEVFVKNNLDTLRDIDLRVTANHIIIWPVLWVIVIIGAITLTVTSVCAAFNIILPKWAYSILQAGMLLCASYPLAMLLAVLAPAGGAGYIIGTAVSTVIIMLLSWIAALIIGKKCKLHGLPILVVFALTAAVSVADILTGGNLCKFAVPSSFQLSGLRFYGIGNEYAGILISMAAVVMVFLFGRSKWSAAIVSSIAIIIMAVLGCGNWGANYGAIITAAVVFGLILLANLRGGFGIWHVIASFAVGVIITVGFAYLDSKVAGTSVTHAGRVAGMVHKFGDQYMFSIVLRKMLLNIQLTFSDQSQKAYLAFAPFLILWFYGIQGKIKMLLANEPDKIAGLKAIVIGSVAAFLFNDSGIVFANIMIAMTVLILLYSLLDDQTHRFFPNKDEKCRD